tara:strand:+ start:183 stop:353 length:171 start_codon:yes stop_codon:yes gene_type:complete
VGVKGNTTYQGQDCYGGSGFILSGVLLGRPGMAGASCHETADAPADIEIFNRRGGR